MNRLARIGGTLDYVLARGPAFLWIYGGGLSLAVAAMLLGLTRAWYGLTALALATALVLALFLAASLWAAHQLYDGVGLGDELLRLAGVGPEGTLAHIYLGQRRLPLRLSRRLTTGQVAAVDVYNPQLAPNRVLVRARRRDGHPPLDPRLVWRDGSINLLPLPDNSIPAVTLAETAGELWQHGDRLCLLREAGRILAPGGRLVLAERVRTPTNLAVMGPAVLRLKPALYWRELLAEAGLELKQEEALRGLVCFFRADKPLSGLVRQLPFEF